MSRGRRAAQLILIGLAALLLAGGVVLWSLSRPHPSPVGLPPADLAAQQADFTTSDGVALSGWMIPGLPGHGVVILVHGSQQNRLAMLSRARFLIRAGYGVLMFDLRAHGESGGGATTEGCKETADLAAAVQYVALHYPDEKRALIGFSLGGAAALLADPPLPVSALVLEAVTPSVGKAYANRLAMRFGPPGRWLAPAVTLMMPAVMGCSAGQLRPIDHVGDIAIPKFFIAGERDQHTTLDDSRELAAAAAPPSLFWIVPDAEHTDNFHDRAPAEYERRVLEFLGRTLGGRASPLP